MKEIRQYQILSSLLSIREIILLLLSRRKVCFSWITDFLELCGLCPPFPFQIDFIVCLYMAWFVSTSLAFIRSLGYWVLSVVHQIALQYWSRCAFSWPFFWYIFYFIETFVQRKVVRHLLSLCSYCLLYYLFYYLFIVGLCCGLWQVHCLLYLCIWVAPLFDAFLILWVY